MGCWMIHANSRDTAINSQRLVDEKILRVEYVPEKNVVPVRNSAVPSFSYGPEKQQREYDYSSTPISCQMIIL